MFDQWVDYRIVVHFFMIREERKLKAVADSKDKILHWAKTEMISKALEDVSSLRWNSKKCATRD